MVLTVTLNSLLEKKLFFKEITSPNSRAYTQKFLAGGKGLNVSRQLNYLGINNHALTFLGGPNGKRMRNILENERISFSAVNTRSETREATLIFDEKNQNLNTYFGVNSEIDRTEIDNFIVRLEKSIINSSIVIFSGSIPNEESSLIIERGIEYCKKYDKISILDTYGAHLNSCISLGPTVVHNNFSEIEKCFNVKLNSYEKISEILNEFYQHKVNLAFLTSGGNDLFASKADFHYQISNPKVVEKDPTGSGDAFMAGIIYGLEKSLVFNDFVRIAVSLGAYNASVWDTCTAALEEVKRLEEYVTIKEIGKKIKLIDDSPTI